MSARSNSTIKSRVAVASRSFAKHATLRADLQAIYEHVTFNDTGRVLSGRELVEFLRGHQRAIVGLEPVDATILAAVPELRVISKYGVGFDALDLAAFRQYGVRLGWSGGVNRRSVAELTLMFAIALLHRAGEASVAVRAGEWNPLRGHQLTRRVVGIIGCGHVGKDLVQLLRPFEPHILANDIRDYSEFYRAHAVEPVSLNDLLERSDVVTLHVPLDASTRGMIGAAEMNRMRRGAVLINTARGGLIDEIALKQALTSGHLAGAGLDVFRDEPPRDQELLALPTLLATPHLGASTEEAVLAMGRAAIAGLENARLVGSEWPA